MKGRETALEAGIVLLALGIVSAVGFLVAGQTLSAGQARARRAEPKPDRGSIQAERHQHISTVAAR